MSRFADGDPEYLRTEQYGGTGNLEARMALHTRFSTNPVDWHRWVFDQLDLKTGERVMEAACGTGALWAKNRERLPPGVHLELTDFSAGMVAETARATAELDAVTVREADVRRLPFGDDEFDLVVCNHALYHVPDRPSAVTELRRVLRPGGRAVFATNGRAHLRQIDDLRRRHGSRSFVDDTAATFGLENGAAQLAVGFETVEVRRFEDHLRVTDADALVAYVRSSPDGELDIDGLRSEVDAAIRSDGAFTVDKDGGLFFCR